MNKRSQEITRCEWIAQERISSMYRYGHRRFRWVPALLLFIFVMMLFTGGFRHAWFFFFPLFFIFPFFFAAGIAALVGLFAFRHRGGRGEFFKQKREAWTEGEKPKRHEGDNSEIFYI
ncbi:MAG TPA: hypothetical protein VKQ72_15935 [Aggregatilineales bacterium]|nr:hypothetical protein [Aggregatilineales bacterium]